MALETKPYDIADYLDSDAMIAAYLTEELKIEDPRALVEAVRAVARTQGGMVQLAEEAEISSEALETALQTGNPDLATIFRVLHAFGVRLSASVATEEPVAA